MRAIPLAIGILFLAPVIAQATIWHVPGDAPTIQAGIDLAQAGDTVEVACGTYPEEGIVMKSGITLRSETGEPDCVLIQAQNSGTVLTCTGVDNTTVIEGFTITGLVGTAMSCHDHSSPSIDSCLFTQNPYASLSCDNESNPTLTACEFSDNGPLASPAAVHLSGSSASFTDCVFTNNISSGDGGAVACNSGAPTFTGCTFTGNSPLYLAAGGAMWFGGSSPTITDCDFSGNGCEYLGGAIHFQYCEPTVVSHCDFVGNTSAGAGGAVSSEGTTLEFHFCLFQDNALTTGGGGAMWVEFGDVSLFSCSILGNESISGGGGFYLAGGEITFTDCTIRNNRSLNGFGGGLYLGGGSVVGFNTDILDNQATSWNDGYCLASSTANLICCEVDLGQWSGDVTLENDNCSVAEASWSWGKVKAQYR